MLKANGSGIFWPRQAQGAARKLPFQKGLGTSERGMQQQTKSRNAELTDLRNANNIKKILERLESLKRNR